MPYGGIFDYFKPVFFVLDKDLLKRIFMDDFEHFHDRDAYHNVRDDPLSGEIT